MDKPEGMVRAWMEMQTWMMVRQMQEKILEMDERNLARILSLKESDENA